MTALAPVNFTDEPGALAVYRRASARVAEAGTHLEVLAVEALAKDAQRLAKMMKLSNEIQADFWELAWQARLRLADEIDAAQERGEIAKKADNQHTLVPRASGNQPTTFKELPGISSQRLADWRKARDAGGEILIQMTRQAALKDDRAPADADLFKTLRGHHRTRFTGKNEWYTPAEYIDAARTCLGAIDLDPATAPAAQKTIRAARFFTRHEDGLRQAWRGRIWLNPPHTQPDIAQFVSKLLSEIGADRATEAILLTHNYTDTSWFHAAAKRCTAICFTRGRIRFVSPDGKLAAPTQGQVFFYFSPGLDRFRATFGRFGFIP